MKLLKPLLSALALALFFSSVALPVPARAADKPNILFLFADDYAYDCVHSLGNEEVSTPNLDTLVERGTTFTHAYNMGSWSGAVCVASRHMLNTGLFVWHAEKASQSLGKGGGKKAADEEGDNARPGKPGLGDTYANFEEKGWMWSQLMKKAGYDTYFTGKWHVKANAENIFDVARNIRPGMPNQTDAGYNRPLPGQEDSWSPYDPKFEGYWKGGKHWSEVVADDAGDFLKVAAKDDDPFFMYIAFNAPHDPRQSPKEFVDRYPQDKVSLPESFVPEYEYAEAMKSGRSLRDEKLAPFPRTEESVKVNRGEYYAIIEHLDVQIGRVLEALKASGKEENTYIFFSADHGLAVGHHGLMGKQNMFDHSVRVPLMLVGPGVPAGKKVDGRVYLQDIMRTSLDLAKAPVPPHVQFRNLMPVMNGKSKGYPAIYGAYLDSQRMVTKENYKLILYPQAPAALLFDLEKDPLEMNDLGSDPAREEKMKDLFAALLELQAECGDTLDLKAVYPELGE